MKTINLLLEAGYVLFLLTIVGSAAAGAMYLMISSIPGWIMG